MASNDAYMNTTRDLIDKIPIIKSPSFWVEKPVELPPDIHPLPEAIEPYFVYPFTIEQHALNTLPQSLSSLHQAHQQRIAHLKAYSEAKERARKAHLNSVAPGWGGDSSGVMMPTMKKKEAAAEVKVARDGLEGLSLNSNSDGKKVESEARDEFSDFAARFG